MCLAAIAVNRFEHFPFVCVANRDEFHHRPTAQMQWWQPNSQTDGITKKRSDQSILSGIDLQSGGTWLGFAPDGKFSLLTNVRDPSQQGSENAPSRGLLVTDYLTRGNVLKENFPAYAGFNLVIGNYQTLKINFLSNNRKLRETAEVVMEENHVHVLSNGLLNEPWPKAVQLRLSVEEISHSISDLDCFICLLSNTLSSQSIASDTELPSTGVPLEWERMLSPIKIVSPAYGTRAQTIAVRDTRGKLHVVENTVSPDGEVTSTVRFTLPPYSAA